MNKWITIGLSSIGLTAIASLLTVIARTILKHRKRKPYEIDPELFAAISVAVLTHRSQSRVPTTLMIRPQQPGIQSENWVMSGRSQQIQQWHPHKRG